MCYIFQIMQQTMVKDETDGGAEPDRRGTQLGAMPMRRKDQEKNLFVHLTVANPYSLIGK